MISAALVALSLGQFTSMQLPPVSFSIDTTKLSLNDQCNDVSTRHARITNTSRGPIVARQGLVSGLHFNGAQPQGSIGSIRPGETVGRGAIYAPGDDNSLQRGEFEIDVSWDDSAIQAERERIQKLADQRLAELKAEGEKLEDAFIDKYERMGIKMRIEHQRIEDENRRKRGEAVEKNRKLNDDYKSSRREYEQGLFCSGCGLTRSQIHAKGERFPHQGQHVVAATQQQLNELEQKFKNLKKTNEDQIKRAEEQTQQSYRTMQNRIREFEDQRRSDKGALDAQLDELKKKAQVINGEKADLMHQLHLRSTEIKTVVVNLTGRCKRTP